jgi:hypothetical protein
VWSKSSSYQFDARLHAKKSAAGVRSCTLKAKELYFSFCARARSARSFVS